MSHGSFQALVNRLETAWSGRPEDLLRQTVGWVSLGCMALAAPVFAGLVLLAAGVVLSVVYPSVGWTLLAGLVSLAGLALAVFILDCLRVRFEPPEGLVLGEEDHPALHRILGEIGDRAGGRKFHQVLLNSEMNSSVVQHPRLGVFGWYRTYLVIGLPLIEALPPEELKAMLAHEVGHLTHRFGRTCTWLHRTREVWERVVFRFSADDSSPPFADFFHWVCPHFNSRMVVLSRFGVLASDRFAVGMVSPLVLASGLRRLEILGKRTAREFWEPLDHSLDDGAALPPDVMERLSEVVRRPVDPGQASAWLAEAMATSPESTDTHPGLAARLSALGLPETAEGELPHDLPGGKSAADELFTPDFLAQARQHFSRIWLEEAGDGQVRRVRKLGLERAADTRKAWNRITHLARLDGLEKVQPEVMALLQRYPAHSGALLMRGSHLAEKSDPLACELLELATSDPTMASRALEVLEWLHANHGREEEAAYAKERAARHDLDLRAALVERSRLSPSDAFFPQDLCDSDQQAFLDLLAGEPAVRRAWLASKEVRHFPRWPLVVVGIELGKTLTTSSRQTLESQLMQLWGGEAYVTIFFVDEEMKPVLRSLLRAVPESEIFRRKAIERKFQDF